MSVRGRLKLAVFISGRGSNMEAIARACRDGSLAAQIVLVISDRADAGGLAVAHALGLPSTVVEPGAGGDRAQWEAALARSVDQSGADLLVLAGFMRVLSAAFVARYAGRILNIHPSLLPKFKGLHTHRRALEAGESEHGASVHFVTAELDGGPVICQGRVAIRAGEDEHSLAARVMREEHRIYRLAIGLIAAGRVRLERDRVMLDGRVLKEPVRAEPQPLRGAVE